MHRWKLHALCSLFPQPTTAICVCIYIYTYPLTNLLMYVCIYIRYTYTHIHAHIYALHERNLWRKRLLRGVLPEATGPAGDRQRPRGASPRYHHQRIAHRVRDREQALNMSASNCQYHVDVYATIAISGIYVGLKMHQYRFEVYSRYMSGIISATLGDLETVTLLLRVKKPSVPLLSRKEALHMHAVGPQQLPISCSHILNRDIVPYIHLNYATNLPHAYTPVGFLNG